MPFGIDSATNLNNSCFNWTNFNNWKGEWPAFVGRYFADLDSTNRYDPAVAGEFSSFYKTTGHVCKYVVPVSAPSATRLETGGSTGNSYGAYDAEQTIASINSFLKSAELYTGTSGAQVYVYLDVEAGVSLTPAYWAGWANSIFYAGNGQGQEIYYPAIYTQFVSSSGTWGLNSDVISALNNACSAYPNAAVQCYGFWSNEPEPYSGCNGSIPSSPSFETFNQQLCGSSAHVPVYVWQYDENCVCMEGGYPGFGGTSNCSQFSYCSNGNYDNNNVDLDLSFTGAENFMLAIS